MRDLIRRQDIRPRRVAALLATGALIAAVTLHTSDVSALGQSATVTAADALKWRKAAVLGIVEA